MDQVVSRAAIRQTEGNCHQEATAKTLGNGALEPGRGRRTHVDGQVGRRETLSLLGCDLNVKLADVSASSVTAERQRKASRGFGRHLGVQKLGCGRLDSQG